MGLKDRKKSLAAVNLSFSFLAVQVGNLLFVNYCPCLRFSLVKVSVDMPAGLAGELSVEDIRIVCCGYDNS